MRALVLGGIATASFIVASVASSLITTMVRPDTPGDLKPTIEKKIKETTTSTSELKKDSSKSPEPVAEIEKTLVVNESPLTPVASQPAQPSPTKGPGNVDTPPPLKPASRGPGNLDEPYFSQPPSKTGPGNL